MTDKGSRHIPSWDGSARTWRKRHREVTSMFTPLQDSSPQELARRLVVLTGSARPLAMSWTSRTFFGSWLHLYFVAKRISFNRDSGEIMQSDERSASAFSMQSFLPRESLRDHLSLRGEEWHTTTQTRCRCCQPG